MSTRFELATNHSSLSPYVVTVSVPRPGWGLPTIELSGILNNNFSLGGTANCGSYNLSSVSEYAQDSANNLINEYTSGGAVGALSSGVKASSGMLWEPLSTSFKSYVNSNLGGFSVEFDVFPDKSGGYSSIVSNLFKLTQPRIEGTTVGSDGTIRDANYNQVDTSNNGVVDNVAAYAEAAAKGLRMSTYLYDDEIANERRDNISVFDTGLIHVSIGDWFKASGLFCTSSSINMSKYMSTNKHPIYATVNLSFEPHRAYSAEHIASWFIR